MADFQWQFDAPTGTYKSHALSMKLFEASVEDSHFVDHAQALESFGRKMGDTVTLTRITAVTEPTDGVLTEGVKISEDDYALSTTSITVKEYGRAIPYTSLAADLSFWDLENGIQRGLRTQMTRTMDTAAATAFKTAKIKYVPTGEASNNIATNGTAAVQASMYPQARPATTSLPTGQQRFRLRRISICGTSSRSTIICLIPSWPNLSRVTLTWLSVGPWPCAESCRTRNGQSGRSTRIRVPNSMARLGRSRTSGLSKPITTRPEPLLSRW